MIGFLAPPTNDALSGSLSAYAQSMGSCLRAGLGHHGGGEGQPMEGLAANKDGHAVPASLLLSLA